ncbi:hypothetical protein [Anoxybacillus sp. FSL W8-1294]|uniref:hypothetical protein n=1 Tax=Anoxybacillus TaxID=150247 RepID=UPI0030D31DED
MFKQRNILIVLALFMLTAYSQPLTLYSYTGGAHGMTVKVPNNFDFHTGKSLQLDSP